MKLLEESIMTLNTLEHVFVVFWWHLSCVYEQLCIPSHCLINIFFYDIKSFLQNVDLQAIVWNLILGRAVRQGMQHKFGPSQWDSRTNFGGPAHVSPQGGHRMKNVGPTMLKNLRSELESHKPWDSWKENRKLFEQKYFMSHLLPCGGQSLSDIKRIGLFLWPQHVCFPEPQRLASPQSIVVAVLLKKTPNHISCNEQRCFEFHPSSLLSLRRTMSWV